MSMTNKPVEPSMEEILASIRKIIAEEPIGTRPDPVSHHVPKAAQRLDSSQKLSAVPEALAMDDVLDMAGGSGGSPGAGAHNGAAVKSADAGWSLGKPAGAATSAAFAAHASQTAEVKADNGPARPEELKPAPDRSDTPGATVPGRTAELETAERPVPHRPDGALSEAQKKVERHLGSLPEVAERPAPLGLRSIREPSRDAKAGSLLGRVAAAQGLAEPPADAHVKTRAASGAVAAGTGSTAKQAEATPAAKTDHAAVGTAGEAKTAAAPAAAAVAKPEPAKPAAGTSKTSLEEAVAEMLRPMLGTWLEANLPRIVEEVVREHVAKAPVPGKDKPAG